MAWRVSREIVADSLADSIVVMKKMDVLKLVHLVVFRGRCSTQSPESMVNLC